MRLIATEEQIRRYLDNLLVELEVEVHNENRERNKTGIMEKITDVVNTYIEVSPLIITEYKNKGNRILGK